MTKLINISEINSNLITSRNISHKIPVEVKELKIGMIKSRTSIDTTKEFTFQEASRVFKLKKYDILLKRVSPVFSSILTEDTDLVLGSNLTCIRIKEEKSKEFYAPYVAAYIDYQLPRIIRQESVMPVLMMNSLRHLEIPKIDFEKQKLFGDTWVLNDKNAIVEKNIIEEKFNYNQNLIFKNLEVI